MDNISDIKLAELKAKVRFRILAKKGNPIVGLALLNKLDQYFSTR
ncbi:hypothetical protein [[Limnothrix rosea] IAM M-220]|nr:hypothetical protein [[Limnothrix rosea] IAM M-220]